MELWPSKTRAEGAASTVGGQSRKAAPASTLRVGFQTAEPRECQTWPLAFCRGSPGHDTAKEVLSGLVAVGGLLDTRGPLCLVSRLSSSGQNFQAEWRWRVVVSAWVLEAHGLDSSPDWL